MKKACCGYSLDFYRLYCQIPTPLLILEFSLSAAGYWGDIAKCRLFQINHSGYRGVGTLEF